MGLMRLRVCLLVLVGLTVLGLPAAAVAEEGCSNEAVRQLESAAHPEGFATALPDCRAYEQVTPLNKDGTNPAGFDNGVQASVAGDGILFPVPANMPGGSSGDVPPFFLGSRTGEGWSDQGLTALREPHGNNEVTGWSEDLSEAITHAVEFTVSGESLVVSLYLRDRATGSFQLGVQYPPLQFGAGFWLVGFSGDDSRMFFETEAQLSPSAAAGTVNLYELHGGVVSLVDVLPDGSAPQEGSSAGSYAWLAGGASNPGGAREHYYTESAVSRDGSRVFFTAGGTEQIYVREDGTRTVPVGAGAFLAATPDGSKVFYRRVVQVGGVEFKDLVEFDVETEQTTDLTPEWQVEGLLGVGGDGSYVYFAANGGSVYLWHEGTVSFIATTAYADNWSPQDQNGSHPKLSRVSSDGRFLLFTASGQQLDRYDAVHGRLACVSCDPSGAPSIAPATLRSISVFLSTPEPAILLRNLSSDGSRVFFESSAALLPRDTNGVQDVYEWEQQGVGSCQGSSESFSASSGGCLYLISSGTSPEESFFADASASGNDVFFFTFQPLVGQDQDGLVDVYDARVGGGFAGQNPPAPPAACEGDGCRPAAGGAPVFGAPVSATFAGAGNQTPPPPAATVPKPKPKAKAKAKHKTVKPKRKKRRGARKAGRARSGAGARGAMRGGK
jgi:hypothetical protein